MQFISKADDCTVLENLYRNIKRQIRENNIDPDELYQIGEDEFWSVRSLDPMLADTLQSSESTTMEAYVPENTYAVPVTLEVAVPSGADVWAQISSLIGSITHCVDTKVTQIGEPLLIRKLRTENECSNF
tara:strand:- start:11161 stop:11550 length:390 start_codon:yes stop_codon:yes gene_type:complete